MDSTLLGEIEPGLWVGGLGAVKEIRHSENGRPCKWTVVSALKAEKLSAFLNATLQELRLAHPHWTIHHEYWDIADQRQSELLCTRLEQILVKMDECLLTDNDNTKNTDDDGVPTTTTNTGSTDATGNVLVHCAFGISRSVAICAAWLISRRKYTLQQALRRIRAVRPEAAPNMGFIASLRALEQCHGNVQAAMQRMSSNKR